MARVLPLSSMHAASIYLVLTALLSATSPLISSIFFRNRGEIERAYPTCVMQSVDPLALKCPLTLYKTPNTTLFLFDEVHHVKGVITEFAPQADLDKSRVILRKLVTDLQVQFGSPKAERTGTTAVWHWSHSHAIADVTLEKNDSAAWVITVAFAEARPPEDNEIPGRKPPPALKPHKRVVAPVL